MSNYTEDTLVQQTTAEYMEQQLGWKSVYAYNNEDFGPDSLLGRSSDQEVVLTRPLRAKLVELNKGLPDEAYDDAVRQIVSVTAMQMFPFSCHVLTVISPCFSMAWEAFTRRFMNTWFNCWG